MLWSFCCTLIIRWTIWAEATGSESKGGADDEIHTYGRSTNTGDQELMRWMVMKGDLMVESSDMILDSMMGPLHALGGDPLAGMAGGDPQGIGYAVYYYATVMFPHENVKLIAVDGVQPTSETIASREYPLWTEVYVVVRANDLLPGRTVELLRDWLLTEEGQTVIAESGYVPIR
jgi:ABC-type phosphate transport system substrate-binding protein